MSSTLSLDFKYVEERAPRGVHDALGQRMIVDHVENSQLLHSDHLIVFSVWLCRLVVKIPPLPGDLEMRLLRATIESGVLNGMPFRVSQENFQTNVKTNVRMGTLRWFMLSLWLRLTDDESIPVSIGPMDQVNRLRRALYRAMQLDLEEMSQFLGNHEMFLVLMQIHIFAILPQLNALPAIGLLKPGEANTRDVIGCRVAG